MGTNARTVKVVFLLRFPRVLLDVRVNIAVLYVQICREKIFQRYFVAFTLHCTHQKTRTVTSWNGSVGKRINNVFGTWNSKHKRGTLLSKLAGNTLTPWYGQKCSPLNLFGIAMMVCENWLLEVGDWSCVHSSVSDSCSAPFIRPEDVASARHQTRPSWGKCEQHRTVKYLVGALKETGCEKCFVRWRIESNQHDTNMASAASNYIQNQPGQPIRSNIGSQLSYVWCSPGIPRLHAQKNYSIPVLKTMLIIGRQRSQHSFNGQTCWQPIMLSQFPCLSFNKNYVNRIRWDQPWRDIFHTCGTEKHNFPSDAPSIADWKTLRLKHYLLGMGGFHCQTTLNVVSNFGWVGCLLAKKKVENLAAFGTANLFYLVGMLNWDVDKMQPKFHIFETSTSEFFSLLPPLKDKPKLSRP